MIKQDLRVGETLEIGEAKIRLVHKSGKVASLVIDAPPSVKIKHPDKRQDKTKDSLTSS